MGDGKKRIGFVIGNYHTDHPGRLVHLIWEMLREEDVELQVFLGTESASFMKDFVMRSNLYDYQYASLCGYTKYEELDLLIISAGTLSIYQNDIPLEEFLRHTPDIPTILMETDHVHRDGISLISDNTQGLSDCVEHLIKVHGLTRIGYVGGPKNNRDAQERLTGYRNTLEKYGIGFREDYTVYGDYSEHVDKCVEELLDRAPDLEAIASANDEMTVSIYRVCKARGLEIGKDIAVTGFDDMLMARYMDPPLTTARQDYKALSKVTVESALKMLRGEKVPSRRIRVPFIRRCSCGCSVAKDQLDESAHIGHEELLRSMQRSREYQHNSWIGSLMNREMLLEVDNPRRFFESVGVFMDYLDTPASYLTLFEHPLRVKRGTLPEFPDKIFMCMRQHHHSYEGFDWDEAPVLYRDTHTEIPGFNLRGSCMTFLLFDEEYQYGVLNAAIEPEKIDFYYMLSLDIGTSLRYMDLWGQQKQYRAELQALARTDSLTGLYNRAGVIHMRENMLGKMTRWGGVMMADLDHLKQINDQFGHHAGDVALRAVADILCQAVGDGIAGDDGSSGSMDGGSSVRTDGGSSVSTDGGSSVSTDGGNSGSMDGGSSVGTDVGTTDNGTERTTAARQFRCADRVIGRVGGDEFMICFVGVSEKEIRGYVDTIRTLCDRYNENSDHPFYVEISAGIAMGRVRNMADWAVLSEQADERLYEAKKTRREFVIRTIQTGE